MSGTFPSSPAPRSVRFGSLQPSRESIAQSLKRQVRTTDTQRWTLSLDFPPMLRSDLAPIYSFIIAQRGRFDSFQYVLPNPLYSPQGIGATGSPNPYVDGSQVSPTNDAQTGRSVLTRGWPASTIILEPGDFLKFGSHSKVYIARERVTSDSSTRATIPIEPAVQLSGGLANFDSITTHNIPFTVALTNDTQEFRLGLAQIFELNVDLIEVY